jgi:hypothetical protein
MTNDLAESSQAEDLRAEFAAEAERLIKSRQQTLIHIEAEKTAVIDRIAETLSRQGPYVYTKTPGPENTLYYTQEYARSAEGIREAYVEQGEMFFLIDLPPINEIVSSWYTFYHAWATLERTGTGIREQYEAVVAFPTMGGTGITGELSLTRRIDPSGTGGQVDGSNLQARSVILAQEDARLAALRRGDAAAVAAGFSDRVQLGLRDLRGGDEYIDLHSRDEALAYFTGVFDEYAVSRLEVLERYVADWFVFTELLWELAPRAGGPTVSFRSFQFSDLTADNKVFAQIGYATPSW